jgi:hypothetical protein
MAALDWIDGGGPLRSELALGIDDVWSGADSQGYALEAIASDRREDQSPIARHGNDFLEPARHFGMRAAHPF